MQNLYQLVNLIFQLIKKIQPILCFLLAQFQNLRKKKVEQAQRKALVQELEEKQLKRMRPSKTIAPGGNYTSYGTSDDEVFVETVRRRILSKPFSY